MAKKIKKIAKLEIMAMQAKPGPELASLGINMMNFCTKFNNLSKSRVNDLVPVLITVYEDKTFDLELKTSPTAFLLKKALKIEKGSANAKTTTVGTLPLSVIKKIAAYKLVDLNAYTIESAIKIISGSAKNMGIKIDNTK